MTPSLDIHLASLEEQAAAHTNVFDVWSKGMPLDEHVRARLESPKHRLADWYVGTLAGRVVVSLGAYPLLFRVRGAEVPGIAIGSVYTVADCRRRGFAAQLIAWVEARVRAAGAAISILYCDIDPRYYAGMGYRLCPSLAGWRASTEAAPDGSLYREDQLREIDPRTRLDALARLYAAYHGAAPLSIARSSAYWQALLERFVDDRFFVLAGGGEWLGYVRLGNTEGRWQIRDFALAEQRDALLEALYRATLAHVVERGGGLLGGWLPDEPAARRLFPLAPRASEITMLKALHEAIVLDEPLLAGTGRFCEVDHV